MGQRQGAVAAVVASLADAPPAPSRGRLVRIVLGFAITAIFVWLFIDRLSWAEISQALASFDIAWLPVALACVAAGYSARITRWWLMLRPAEPSLPWRAAAAPFLISIAVNNVAPLRAGDVLRLFAFRDRPALGTGRVLGTVIVERLLDLAALLTIFFVLLPQVPAGHISPSFVRGAAVVAGAGAVAALGLLLLPALGNRILARLAATGPGRGPIGARVLGIAGDLVGSVLVLGSVGRVAALVGLTAAVWSFEGGVFVTVARAMHVGGTIAAPMFALAAATLSTLLPSSPGYVGTFHFFASAALKAFGAGTAVAAAFAVVTHLVLWVSTTLAGFVVFLSTSARHLRTPSSAR